MKDKENASKDKNDSKIPKSSRSQNTYKDFNKICRAYYDELMHISKSDSPSLSKKDIIILNDVIHEIVDYSNELLNQNCIQEAKKILDIGLVISDFFLKIFGEMAEKGSNTINNSKLSDKLKYPLSLKLLLLKANFKILINYESDYKNGEKNLNEIIEIQLYLKTSSYHLASSKFYMAKIKYFFKNYEEAKKYALEAKNLFENYNNNKKENYIEENDKTKNKKEEAIIEKKITQNVSNILSFLAQLFLIKNDYKNAATCYENGYYLNLGRHGAENQITEYFKNKLDLINEELKKYPSLSQPKPQTMINSNSPSYKEKNNNYKNNNNNYYGNIMHKGKADTFCFKIPTSSLYEPFLLSIYSLGEDDNNRYAPELFLGNLCFDKQKLARFLKLKGTNYNPMFYTDENLNIILGNIFCLNGLLSFNDKNLKSCLISSSCPMKKK
jgi:hypothetical protein